VPTLDGRPSKREEIGGVLRWRDFHKEFEERYYSWEHIGGRKNKSFWI